MYSGVAFVELWLGDVDRRHPSLAALVGHGTMFALHWGAGMFAQRNGGATIRVYAAFLTRSEETDRSDKTLAVISMPQGSGRSYPQHVYAAPPRAPFIRIAENVHRGLG